MAADNLEPDGCGPEGWVQRWSASGRALDESQWQQGCGHCQRRGWECTDSCPVSGFAGISMNSDRHLVVFFTFDVALATWRETGLLSREIGLYTKIAERGWRVTLLTYGGKEDLDIARGLAHIEVVALYDGMPRPQSSMVRLMLSPMLVWKARRVLRSATVLKTNQIWGAWNAVLAKRLFVRPLLGRGGYEPYAFALTRGVSLMRRLFTKWVCRMAYRAADRICLATDQDKAFVALTFREPSEKIEVRANWVDTQAFRPD